MRILLFAFALAALCPGQETSQPNINLDAYQRRILERSLQPDALNWGAAQARAAVSSMEATGGSQFGLKLSVVAWLETAGYALKYGYRRHCMRPARESIYRLTPELFRSVIAQAQRVDFDHDRQQSSWHFHQMKFRLHEQLTWSWSTADPRSITTLAAITFACSVFDSEQSAYTLP